MQSIFDLSKTNENIGLRAREPIEGPENSLVERFIDELTSKWKKQDRQLAIFQQPKLDSGFPDVVLVEYTNDGYKHWNDSRSGLLLQDIKILHHLHWVNHSDQRLLRSQLGLREQELCSSLERLADSKLVFLNSGQWFPIPLSEAFAITDIIAIEAKMNDWQSAFRQAHINKRFASKSYVLTSVKKPTSRIVQQAIKLGLGIFTGEEDNVQRLLKSSKSNLPLSYVSWLFNEWTGRSIFLRNSYASI